MGRVVNLSPVAMRTSLFGDNSSFMGNYIQHQIGNMSSMIGNAGNQMLDVLSKSYNVITDEMRKYAIKSELEREGVVELDNNFKELLTFEDLQQANVTMQRWVMACPEVKSVYLDQNCSGYADSYVNLSGNQVGEDDYDYRRVMNCVVQTDESNDTAYARMYVDDLLPGDRELDFYEQGQILQSWETIRHVMSTCKKDFTEDSDVPQNMNI